MSTSPEDVDAIVRDAATASLRWATSTPGDRAAALCGVADALDGAADDLVALAGRETHLGEPRLRGELTRTSFQLRFFGDVLAAGRWADARIDHADPDWPMGAARPDLRRQLEPIGPVLVFAASNFPFAFSVIGGDSASALAAGNAVVLKAHPGHPELSEATAALVADALDAAGAPEHLFQLISGDDAGVRALQATSICAAAFTGSVTGGRALFDIAVRRAEPIPFYGELGSVNPVVVTPAAARGRAREIADGYLASMTGSAGQLCTKPGILAVPGDSELLGLLAAADLPDTGPLLNPKIDSGFREAQAALAGHPDVRVLARGADGPAPQATLLATTVDALVADPHALVSEMFGPASVVATYSDEDALVRFAAGLEGQLTAGLFAEPDDEVAARLLPLLARRAGRVLWNQWPTGVSVTWAQQHGGPYPATTAVTTTSVGAAAITRFLRPVTYQNVPDALLPPALREANPLGLPRTVDGVGQAAP